MKAHFKRALSLLLCTAMVFGCFGGVTGIIPTSRAATTQTNLLADLDPDFEDFSLTGKINSGWLLPNGSAACDDSRFTKKRVASLSDYSFGNEYGSWVLQMNDNSETGGAGLVSPKYEAQPGKYYQAWADILSETSINLYIHFYDASGNAITPQYCRGISETNGVSERVGALCRAPEGTAYVAVNYSMTAVGYGYIYLDNLFLGLYDPATEDDIPGIISVKTPQWGVTSFAEEHPRLYFTAGELNTLRTEITDSTVNSFGYSMKAAYEELIAQADAYLAEESFHITWNVPHKGLVYDVTTFPYPNNAITYTHPDGNQYTFDVTVHILGTSDFYPYFNRLGQFIQDRLQYLSLAYALTGDETYANKAIDYTLKMAQWPLWSQKNNAGGYTSDMGCAYFTTGVATVYDMCYDVMTETERTTISQAIINKGLTKLAQDLTMPIAHNERLAKASGLMVGASAVINEQNRQTVEPFMTCGYNYVAWYLDDLLISGEQEGYSYADHALESAIEGIDTISRVGKIDSVVGHDYFTEIFLDWVIYGMTPGSGTMPPISDTNPGEHKFFKTMNLLNAAGNAKAGFYLQESGIGNTSSAFDKLLYTSTNGPAATTDEIQQTATIIDEIGYGFLRSGFGSLDVALTMISNNSLKEHNHYDQNSFVLAFNGKEMVSDFGYGIVNTEANHPYGYYKGHTTIFVDDEPQSVKGNGELSMVLGSDLYGHLLGSAADAYGGKLTQADRHAIMLNHKDRPYYVIIDELASTEERTYGWNLYTRNWSSVKLDGQTSALGATVSGNKITVSKGTSATNNIYDCSADPDTLFVHFVGKDSLNLSALEAEEEHTEVDWRFRTIRANTATKVQNYQFMTVLSTEVGDDVMDDVSVSFADANTISSTATSGQNEQFAWSTSSAEAKDMVKPVAFEGKQYLFFRGAAAGDYYEMYFTVETAGEYNVRLNVLQSNGYGKYEVFLDGVSYGVYDGQSATAAENKYSLGVQNVSAGAHTVKLVLVGKADESDNYWMSCGGIDLLGVSDINVDKVYDDTSLLGAIISYKENLQDIIVHNRTTGEITADSLTTNGKQTTLLGVSAGMVTEGFAAISASALTYRNQVLLSASSPLNVAADYTDASVRYQVKSAQAQQVSLYIDREVTLVKINEQAAQYTVNGNVLTLTVPAGESVVSVNCDHSSIVWTENVEPSCTEPGRKEGACQECGATLQETIDALGHDLLHFAATEPDGVQLGHPEYWYCERCKTYFADEQCTQIIEDIDSLATRLDFDKDNIVMGESLSLIFAIAKSKINGTDTSKYVAKWSVEHANGTESGEIPYAKWTTYTISGKEYWGIKVSDLAAKEMGDDVNMYICYGDVQVSNVKTMSIRDYVLDRLAASTDSMFKAVCVDMLHYGAAAQIYFNYKTNELVNAGQPVSKTVPNINQHRRVTKGADNFLGSAVRFVSDLTISFAVKETSGIESGKVTFINHKGKGVTELVDSYTSITVNGTPARQFEFGGMVIADLDAIIKVELYDAQGNVVVSLIDSLDAYVGRTASTSRMYDLAQSFAKFSTAAYAYFHRNDDLGEYN